MKLLGYFQKSLTILIAIIYLTIAILHLTGIEDPYFPGKNEANNMHLVVFGIYSLLGLVQILTFIKASKKENKLDMPFLYFFNLLLLSALTFYFDSVLSPLILITFILIILSASLVISGITYILFMVFSTTLILVGPGRNYQLFILIPVCICFLTIANLIIYNLVKSFKEYERETDKARWTATEFVRVNQRLQNFSEISYAKGIQEERIKISRNLHDSVGHDLTSILVLFRTLREYLPQETGEIQVIAKKIEELIENSLENVRTTVSQLRIRREVRLSWPLKWRRLGMNFTDFTGTRVTMAIEELPGNISLDAGEAIYHIIQEGLTNAIRHGRASHIDVVVKTSKKGDLLLLHISDNGRGDNMKNIEMGNGLKGMKERIQPFKGEMLFETIPEKGFDLAIEFPLSWVMK